MNRVEFGQLVKALRQEHRDEKDIVWTQKKLGQETGLGELIIGKIERGQRINLDEVTLLRLVNALQLTSLERREFFFAALGIDGQQVARKESDPKIVLNDLLQKIKEIQLPVHISDPYGDVIAANSITIALLNISPTYLNTAQVLPAGFNHMRVVFDPKSGFKELVGSQWHNVAIHVMQLYRGFSLRYRYSNYFGSTLKALFKYPLFKQYWQYAYQYDEDFYLNSVQYNYYHRTYGPLSYLATSTQVLTQAGELHLVIYCPASPKTSEVFKEIVKQVGMNMHHLASWPEKERLDQAPADILVELNPKSISLHLTSNRDEMFQQRQDTTGVANDHLIKNQFHDDWAEVNRVKDDPSNELLNLFFPWDPIDQPRYFYGRETQLKQIFGSLDREPPMPCLAIIGLSQSGKTSLLNCIQKITQIPQQELRSNQRNDWLKEPENYLWAFVDFRDPEMLHQQSLLHYLLRQLGLPIPEPCHLGNFNKVVKRELKKCAIILLDNFGKALDPTISELDIGFWNHLQALKGDQPRLGFILAVHQHPSQLVREKLGGDSPFFINFSTIKLQKPLTEDEARELIVKTSPLHFDEVDLEWIVKTSRWPCKLQKLGHELLLALRAKEWDDSWKERGLEQIEPLNYLLES
jgi:transcriptional regulator with XRE-family HTH domain